jgi:malate permease and related proteins
VAGELFAIIAPLFVTAAIGFVWAKSGQPYESAFVTQLTTLVGVPALVFASLARLELSVAVLGEIAGAMALALALFALVGGLVLRVFGLPFHTYLPALMFPNTGNMGLPLALFAFGRPGLALAVACFTVAAVVQFSAGQWIAAGRSGGGEVFKTPLIYAALLGVACAALEYRLPPWLGNTVELIGGLTIPLMLLTLGVSLARLKVAGMKVALAMSLLRLGLGFGGGVAVAWALGLTGVARGVLILECAMPVAVFNYLFAQRYDRAPEDIAGAILISTVIGFALLPLLLLYLLP